MNPLFLCSLRNAIVFFEIFSASVAEKQNDARKADERESSKKDCRRPRLNQQTESIVCVLSEAAPLPSQHFSPRLTQHHLLLTW